MNKTFENSAFLFITLSCLCALISVSPLATVKWTHQQLGGPQDVQVQTLDPGVVDAHLPVDPRALDADQHPEVGGQPGGT